MAGPGGSDQPERVDRRAAGARAARTGGWPARPRAATTQVGVVRLGEQADQSISIRQRTSAAVSRCFRLSWRKRSSAPSLSCCCSGHGRSPLGSYPGRWPPHGPAWSAATWVDARLGSPRSRRRCLLLTWTSTTAKCASTRASVTRSGMLVALQTWGFKSYVSGLLGLLGVGLSRSCPARPFTYACNPAMARRRRDL